MNSNPELDLGRQTPEGLRQAVVEAAEAKVQAALLATGYTVDQQPAATPVTAAMQGTVEFVQEQNQVISGDQDGFALAA